MRSAACGAGGPLLPRPVFVEPWRSLLGNQKASGPSRDGRPDLSWFHPRSPPKGGLVRPLTGASGAGYHGRNSELGSRNLGAVVGGVTSAKGGPASGGGLNQ